MFDNKFIAWTSFSLWLLALVLFLLPIVFPGILYNGWLSPEAAFFAVGVPALLSAAFGFMSFRTPQGKIGAVGGLILLLVVLVVTPFTVVRGSR